jgi:hypothetical protein
MTKQSTELRVLARRAVQALPEPMAKVLRDARRALLNLRSRREVFRQIARENSWDGTESVSGPGSSMEATSLLRAALPKLLTTYKCRTLLDIPCGDAYWISRTLTGEINYIGADIVPELVERNRASYPAFGRFEVIDLVSDELPCVDMIMIRDCFIHLPNRMVSIAIENVKRSDARYVLVSTYPHRADNIDIEIGGFRAIDLEKAPFSLPKPLEVIVETEGIVSGKSMALWDVKAL